jgi:hypothetical protein
MEPAQEHKAETSADETAQLEQGLADQWSLICSLYAKNAGQASGLGYPYGEHTLYTTTNMSYLRFAGDARGGPVIDIDAFMDAMRLEFDDSSRIFCEQYRRYVVVRNTLSHLADSLTTYERARAAAGATGLVRIEMKKPIVEIGSDLYNARIRQCLDGDQRSVYPFQPWSG